MSADSSTIKILSLVPYKIYPAQTGGQKAILFFYNYLSKLLPVTIVSTKNNELKAQKEIEFLADLPNSGLRYVTPSLFFTLRTIIERNRITHLIIEHPYFGWLGILLKKLTKVKLIVRSHNIEGIRWKTLGKWWWSILWNYEKFTHRLADHSFFITGADKDYAVKHFKLSANKCTTITYGIGVDRPPSNKEKQEQKNVICTKYEIGKEDKIFLFNGVLSYKPNLDAVNIILKAINPVLLEIKDFKYKIIICGKDLPSTYLNSQKEKNIIFTGFVSDIHSYYMAADVFINPVIEGGGIKTKLVEALSYNVSAVSTKSGAAGVPANVCGRKLMIVDDGNWQNFLEELFSIDVNELIPPTFFEYFFWGNIAQKAANVIISI